MKIEIKESREGEFNLPHEELMELIETALITALRRVITHRASPSPDHLLVPPTRPDLVEGEPLSKRDD